MKKPLILISNDDSIYAGGIKALVEVAQTIGEVIVVAPATPQSAQSHAITISSPLRLKKSDIFGDIEAYTVNGSPVDCIKLANYVVLKERKPDIILSGINHGSNASINILYSGTMAAAMEGSLENVNSIGFSLLDFSPDADFDPCKPFVKTIIEQVLEHGIKDCSLLNVNIPKLPANEIKGIRICRQAMGIWREKFAEKEDPFGRPYYWLTGEFINEDDGDDSDIHALNEGYISVVPSMHDLTAHKTIGWMKGLPEFE